MIPTLNYHNVEMLQGLAILGKLLRQELQGQVARGTPLLRK